MNTDIFISYAHADDVSLDGSPGVITKIFDFLSVRGRQRFGRPLTIFKDTHIASGTPWERQIFETLHGSKIFLPVFSPSWINSEFCNREWDSYWSRLKSDLNLGTQTLIVPVSFELIDSLQDIPEQQRRLQIKHHYHNGMRSEEFEKVSLALVSEICLLLRALAPVPSTASTVLFDTVTPYFQNREPEQARIKAFLQDPARRLLRVVGKSGYGKTALIQRVLNDVLTNPDDVPSGKHVITLNAAKPGGVSINALLASLRENFNASETSREPGDSDSTSTLRINVEC